VEIELNYVSWMVLGWLCLAPIGAAFGAAAGALAWQQGHATGSPWARAAADRLAHWRGVEFSPTGRGTVIGTVDGFLFLGVIGSLVGLLAGYGDAVPAPKLLLAAAAGAGLLALTAALLGWLAHRLIHGRGGGSVFLVTGGVGALLGLALAGLGGAGYGLLAGSVVGLVAFGRGQEPP
jgi:hypothetical protein